MPSWESVLDALAERLRAQQQAIELHGVIPAELIGHPIPMPDGEMPEHLLLRGLALLEQMRELEAQAGIELGRLRSRHA